MRITAPIIGTHTGAATGPVNNPSKPTIVIVLKIANRAVKAAETIFSKENTQFPTQTDAYEDEGKRAPEAGVAEQAPSTALSGRVRF